MTKKHHLGQQLQKPTQRYRFTHMLRIPFLCLSLAVIMVGCDANDKSSQQAGDSTVIYQVGHRTMSFVDSSRAYRPGVGQKDKLRFRPVDIDIWYPAEPSAGDSTLRFGYFLQSFQELANFYSAPQTFDGLRMDIAKSFCEGFGCSQPALLLQYPTSTFIQPKRVGKAFPLILYLASYNSLGYENYLLFESLARQGYVVASVNSIGRYPGDMTMNNADLMEQVEDANQILKRLKQDKGVDTTRIGVLGYSWGGLAGSILAMQRNDIDAVVSLDGSEFHHYGHDKADDKEFDGTIGKPSFKNAVLSVPYLRLESNPYPGTANKDSVYNFLAKVSALRRVIKIDSADHQDFSSLPTVVRLSGECPPPTVYLTISELTISHFGRYLKNSKSATE